MLTHRYYQCLNLVLSSPRLTEIVGLHQVLLPSIIDSINPQLTLRSWYRSEAIFSVLRQICYKHLDKNQFVTKIVN